MRPGFTLIAALLFASCGDGATQIALTAQPVESSLTIAAIQGDGAVSPYAGKNVAVSGVVTGDFQEGDADSYGDVGGFYLQQEEPDGDPQTSDGVFVYDGMSPKVDVNVGDRVTVHGIVKEHFGETQIVSARVVVTGSGSVAPTDVELPATNTVRSDDGDLIANLEHLEGMLLRFPQPLTVTNLRGLERFGTVSLSQGGRLYQFTNGNRPDPSGYEAHKAENARRSLELDDGRRDSNPEPIRYLNAGTKPGYSIRAGDAITGLTGNLRYSRGSGPDGEEAWRIMPTADPTFESRNPRPGVPDVPGSTRVASFNVLNLFTTIDTGADTCGPLKNDRCRGADSEAEFRRQLDKTATALALMKADIVGLTELENNASESLRVIVDALNRRMGSEIYDFVDTGVIHDDAIKPGFIFNSATVSLLGDFALLDNSVDPRFNDSRNRPALAQTFRSDSNGAVLTVVVNHLKSKGSSCDKEGDPNTGDGQGNCNRTRTSAAEAIARWIATDPTGSGDEDFLVIGDPNAYAREDPLRALEEAGLKNLFDGIENPYSFIFDKQAGALDHALATPGLVAQVTGVLEWHINADEPPLLDYNLEHGRDPSLFDASVPYRASDHDPVIVGLDLTP